MLSGGLDSMVTAALAREAGRELYALTVDYGQRHVREIESARAIARRLGAARVQERRRVAACGSAKRRRKEVGS